MKKEIISVSLTSEIIREKIHIIRGMKVVLDRDLAELYGVPTKRLNEAVKRNLKRFPEDFMFQLDKDEINYYLRSQFATLNVEETEVEDSRSLRSQFATLNTEATNKAKRGVHIKYKPIAFTEHGIAMLSSVLNSDRAIQVNIQIIRVFTKMREMIDAYQELREKVEEMEQNNETNFTEIFRIIRLLIHEEEKPKNKIGFSVDQRES